jgi:magnesium chelatase subunit D
MGRGQVRVDSLPFSAVVGQDDAKLALVLAACDRRIGGVLLRGDKGSAKSTLARGMAALLPGAAPFVELPLGATEDRVVGTLDLAAALTGGEKRFDPGLLHAADGGVLYVDEVNLLPDHLVDVLLDVAASGVNRIEREGVSHAHASRFVLVGSMNPEEGDLRPQLLDRFGLAVDVRTPVTVEERAAALRRRLAFDADPASVAAAVEGQETDVMSRLAGWRPAEVPSEMVEAVAAVCAAAGAEGLRADLTICRAAAALAGWEGRRTVTGGDVRRVAPMALAHRARRDPLDPSSAPDRAEIEQALDQNLGSGESDEDQRATPGSAIAPPLPVSPSVPLTASGRRDPAPGPRGRVVGARRPEGPVTSVAVGATVREAVIRRGADPATTHPDRLVEPSDIRQAVRQHRGANLIVIAVDASGSMGAAQRMEAAKGAVVALLRDAYQRRDQVSLVSFRGDDAEVVLRPTSSVEVARARLTDLATGGRTPLAAGLRTALDVATRGGRAGAYRPLVVLITDARATVGSPGEDPFESATAAAVEFRRAGIPSAVIDVEATGAGGGTRLGLAARLAAAMGGSYVPIHDLTPAAVEDAVRQAGLR